MSPWKVCSRDSRERDVLVKWRVNLFRAGSCPAQCHVCPAMKGPTMLPASSKHPHFYSLQHPPRTKQALLPPMPPMALVPLVHSSKHVLPRLLQRICMRLDGRGVGRAPGPVRTLLLSSCSSVASFSSSLRYWSPLLSSFFGTSMPPHSYFHTCSSSIPIAHAALFQISHRANIHLTFSYCFPLAFFQFSEISLRSFGKKSKVSKVSI